MLRTFLVLFSLAFGLGYSASAQSAAGSDSFRVVTWNLEWWGDGSVHNIARQVSKTHTLLTAIDADFYGFQEIVSVDSFQQLVSRLPNGPWDAVVSTYGSSAPTPQSSNYAGAQKLGFLYKPAQFRNVTSRAFMLGHPYTYGDFASGRYPLLVQGELLCRNGSWKPMAFIVLHAKASSDNSSCNRREEGSYLMKDSLDRKFAGQDFLILGDFNDDLDTSICTDTRASAYANFVADSIVAPAYKAITLPLTLAGERSTDGYSSLIDHFIASATFGNTYIPGSARSLRRFVGTQVTNYTSDVSDHYPVLSTYRRPTNALGVSTTTVGTIDVFPNPATQVIQVSGTTTSVGYSVYDLTGRILKQGVLEPVAATVPVGELPAGTYLLQIRPETSREAAWLRFVKQ